MYALLCCTTVVLTCCLMPSAFAAVVLQVLLHRCCCWLKLLASMLLASVLTHPLCHRSGTKVRGMTPTNSLDACQSTLMCLPATKRARETEVANDKTIVVDLQACPRDPIVPCISTDVHYNSCHIMDSQAPASYVSITKCVWLRGITCTEIKQRRNERRKSSVGCQKEMRA